MGGDDSDYSQDVNFVRSTGSPDIQYTQDSLHDIMDKSAPHDSVLPKYFPMFFKDRDILIYPDQDLLIAVIDGTGSMGKQDISIIRDKIVLLQGQIDVQGYLKNVIIMVCIVGDSYTDRHPLQVCRPARGDELIAEIEKTRPDLNGGANNGESYNLMAKFLNDHVILQDGTKKPFLFWFGDEYVHPTVEPSHVLKFIGDEATTRESTEETFRKLCKKFNVWRFHRQYEDGSQDEEIMDQWRELIGAERVQKIITPKALADDMLAIVAVGGGSRTIQGFLNDLRGLGNDPKRIQDPARIKEVEAMLNAASGALVPIADIPKLPDRGQGKRVSGSKRL